MQARTERDAIMRIASRADLRRFRAADVTARIVNATVRAPTQVIADVVGANRTDVGIRGAAGVSRRVVAESRVQTGA